MPIYEYYCDHCDHTFEKLVSYGRGKHWASCSKCSRRSRRSWSAFGITHRENVLRTQKEAATAKSLLSTSSAAASKSAARFTGIKTGENSTISGVTVKGVGGEESIGFDLGPGSKVENSSVKVCGPGVTAFRATGAVSLINCSAEGCDVGLSAADGAKVKVKNMQLKDVKYGYRPKSKRSS